MSFQDEEETQVAPKETRQKQLQDFLISKHDL